MRIRRATHPAPRSDGKELRLASDSLPRHFQRHGHTVYPQHGQPPIDRTEAVHRRHVEGSARPSVENSSLLRGRATNRKTGAYRLDSRSVAPAPLAIVEKSRPASSSAEGNPNSDSTAWRENLGNTTASIPFVVSDTPIQPQGVRKTQAVMRNSSGVSRLGEGCLFPMASDPSSLELPSDHSPDKTEFF